MKRQKTARPSRVSRRDVFKSAGAGLLASEFAAAAPARGAARPAASPVRFAPGSGLTQISPNLYVLRDACNVYVLKDGNRALLIDFGSGHVLSLLGQIGVTKVDAILHTHHQSRVWRWLRISLRMSNTWGRLPRAWWISNSVEGRDNCA